jgi:quinol-cytochrome oxidoreductase complex cytochrome b subunit
MVAANTGDFSLLRAFGAFFMIDMFLRLFAGQRFVPSLRIADFLVRKQRPEWVDAKPKQTAWTIGLVMVIIACFMMGWLGMRDEVVLALCGVCMTFLFAEAAFGFCAGCWLHQRFAKEKPQLCSGDVCQFEKEETK